MKKNPVELRVSRRWLGPLMEESSMEWIRFSSLDSAVRLPGETCRLWDAF